MRHVIATALIGIAAIACGRTSEVDNPPPVEGDESHLEKPGEITVRGCVGATGRPDLFLLSVSERDTEYTRDDVPGSVVPRPGDSPLPPGTAGRSSPATRPRPGYTYRGETTAWTLETEVYQLVGTGGLDLTEHLGHTVDVTGTVAEAPEPPGGATAVEARTAATPRPGSLVVRTAEHVFDNCLPQMRK